MTAVLALCAFLFFARTGFDSQPGAASAVDGSPSTAASAAAGGPKSAGPPAPASGGAERVYEVHKRVSDFPDREDLSTPEAAYATIHRAYAAEGDAAWPRLTVSELRRKSGSKPISRCPKKRQNSV